jgi:hypothetical protein
VLQRVVPEFVMRRAQELLPLLALGDVAPNANQS